MGTHSLIIMRVKRDDGTYRVYSVLYQQFDGYPGGVGKQLILFLQKIMLVNGYEFRDMENVANGAGCLFAQIIALFKLGVGGAYLQDPNDFNFEEFNYFVDVNENKMKIHVTVQAGDNEMLFSGSLIEASSYAEFDLEAPMNTFNPFKGFESVKPPVPPPQTISHFDYKAGKMIRGPMCRHLNIECICRNCQIVAFLCIRQRAKLSGDSSWTNLIVDLCKMIFRRLPDQRPAPLALLENVNAVATLEECGPTARTRITKEGDPISTFAVCGTEFRSKSLAELKVFCPEFAKVAGKSGCWTCERHRCRQTSDIRKLNRPNNLADIAASVRIVPK